MEIQESKIKSFVTKYNSEKKALISILQDIQEEYNYLPQDALRIVSETTGIPLIDIVGVATFYRAFSLEPRGRHLVTVCLGTACHVRGGLKILEEFEKKLNIKAGETTEDGKFSLQTVACLGCCAIGPVVVIDDKYHAQTTIRKVVPILKKYMTKRERK
ncbi:MAG: NADH-quinone oxidoreductase subunit NuoE [Candidatus Aminicenantes bacterium]|nr:NADH-quinone oxidoreductase subunit NuoE [Candidatus Aminicenantes bacterium]MDH5704595.1 NADH-quinone oxidoreductase subunit NuoE [Candidatus Aminicenantes bacterium]